MIADVPFGAFLSGGIDSSAIVGLMAGVSSKPIETFSITFNENEFSEENFSGIISKRFNTNHHEIKLCATDFLDELPNALNAMDQTTRH
jgi:asparagine synthase (glutamine-hydrolysing)